MRWIRGSFDPLSHGGDDLGWAVACLTGWLRRLAVDFDELGVVDIRAEGVFDRLEIGAVSIGCELDAIGEARFEILHQEGGRDNGSIANKPGDE